NNFYGTHCESARQSLEAGKDILLDIDVQGAAQVRKVMPQAVLIFILPPSFKALSKRLQTRGLDSPEVIQRRLQAAASEAARYKEFDYVIINDDLEKASQALVTITRAERLRPVRIEAEIQRILSSFNSSRLKFED